MSSYEVRRVASWFIRLIMVFLTKITGERVHYLDCPEEILSWRKVDQILFLGHFLPSAILTVLAVVKILPEISATYAEELEQNSNAITISAISIFILVLLINGYLIEKTLEKFDKKYFNHKKNSNS